MNQIKHQLNISDSMVDSGIRMFRVASTMNFIQGRTHRDVAAVVLYVACRQEPTCKVMLIDLADIIKTDVFKLGRILQRLSCRPSQPAECSPRRSRGSHLEVCRQARILSRHQQGSRNPPFVL